MKKRLLIVDDQEINRSILAEIFKDEYDILEACDGDEAIKIINGDIDISAVCLDLIMPRVNGFDVLENMNHSGKIKDCPVFLITGVNDMKLLQEGYKLGVADIITKPFVSPLLKNRVGNVIELYSYKNHLEDTIQKEAAKMEFANDSLIELFATIVEFRDCNTGVHSKHICNITDTILRSLGKVYPEYRFSQKERNKITKAALLHDIGKIAVPDNILNKPARLTAEEFEIMKSHTVKGHEILLGFPKETDVELYNYACDICRHHHEKWDGKGYPDGLSGDDISIWSQAVAIADCYDALTSDRVYKKAFNHDTAMRMIIDGECGAFNPKIIKAFEIGSLELEKEKKDDIMNMKTALT